MRYLLVWLVLVNLQAAAYGQSYLLFQKNRYRQARYKVGDKVSFQLKGEKKKITDRIKGFEDSLIVFENSKLNPSEISALYADEKTKLWYILRFKYKTLLPVAGAGYLLLDVLNSGQLRSEALLVGGSLITAGLLAKWLISERIKIKGHRKLVVIASPPPLGSVE